jgi:hypothetical protein
MICPRLKQICLYLERELPFAEAQALEEHFTACPRCRMALEEQRRLLEAAEHLPSLELPSDFAERVMARIFPAPRRLWGWLAALAAGSALVAALLILIPLSGRSVPALIFRFGQWLWNSAKDLALFLVKAFKLLLVSLKVLPALVGELIHNFSRMTSIIDPALQICILLTTLILALMVFWGVRKLFLAGEKR